MIINIDDKTNSAKMLYYQSLALLFLPCEKFSNEHDENKMFVKAYEDNGTYYAKVSLVIGDKTAECSMNEGILSAVPSQMKNLIGRTVLGAAYKIFDKKSVWGISTGVKPVKLAKSVRNKCGNENLANVLENSYAISPNKVKLCIDALSCEDKIMESMPQRPCSIYISIPFCPSKCHYCSFVSCTTPRLLSLIPEYLVKLDKEIKLISKTVKLCNLNVVSIYVGGGTPAILSESQIEFLMMSIRQNFGVLDKVEISFEAGRPDCVTLPKLRILKDYGVNRISVNTQSTNDEILKSVGRNHTYLQFLNALEDVKGIGFDCVNTDLIAGLPGESVESFKNSINQVCSLSPENITIHAFTLKKASDYRDNDVKDFYVCSDDAQKMIDFSYEKLSQNAYTPYYVYRQKNTVGNLDNTGYCKPSKECMYNIVTMGEYHTVLAAGAGAVSKLVSDKTNFVTRMFSPKYPYEFLNDTKYSGFDVDTVVDFYNSKYTE